MTLTPSWQTDTKSRRETSPRHLLQIILLLAVGGGLGIFWRELFEALANAASRISSLG